MLNGGGGNESVIDGTSSNACPGKSGKQSDRTPGGKLSSNGETRTDKSLGRVGRHTKGRWEARQQ
ncbi:hypothetical protein GCM10009811_00850 [Nostocoides veronense]|uniref:Uncharacterized protein n=1 Tax=Nostocoides veronense TaxID=330836 RepID=A0ABP4XE51_9MICO